MAPSELTLQRPAPAARHVRSPLGNGDVLTAPEFLRRYELMPEVKKAELIEGIVYLGSPVRIRRHAKPDNLIQGLLCCYAAQTPGTEAAGNATTILDLENVPQPDAFLRLLEDCGGQSRLNEDDYLEGAPELIVEIAGSTAAKDLHAKKRAYRRAGVREYLVWVTSEPALLAFRRSEDDFDPAPVDDDGVWRSQVFPGLWVNVAALLELNAPAVLATLNRGLAAKEHAALVHPRKPRRVSRVESFRRPPVLFAMRFPVLLGGFLAAALAVRAAEPLFTADFSAATVGAVPDGMLVLDGGFAVREADGEKFLELPGAPLDSFGVLWGPAKKEDVTATARFFSTGQGRRFPVFGLSLNGVAGYRLQVVPAKKAVEILKGDEIRATAPFTWASGAWTRLRVQVRKLGDAEWIIEGRAWVEGAPEPEAWTITWRESTPPIAGRAAVWGQPFSGTPIRFDDLRLGALKP